MLLVLSFLASLVVFSGQRFVFYIWNHQSFLNIANIEIIKAFLLGISFDLTAAAWLWLLAFPFIIASTELERAGYSRWISRSLFILPLFLLHFPFLILNAIDPEMVSIVGQRFTYGALFNFKEVPGKTTAFIGYYWQLFLSCLFFSGLFLYLLFLAQKNRSFLRKHYQTALPLLVASVFVTTFQSAASISNPMVYNLTINTTFNFIESIAEIKKGPITFLEKPSSPLDMTGPSQIEGFRPKKPRNIVLIILESFNLDYMGVINPNEGYTPFLDELSKKSLFFKNNFANGRRSIEGVASTLAGVPSLTDTPFILSDMSKQPFEGIGTLLQEHGYHTSFMHGAMNGTMRFDELMKKIGVTHYYGLNEYPRPQDHDGVWGIPDLKYLQYSIEMMNQFPQPFFNTIFTLSSHHPFHVPPEFRGQFPKGTLDIHESIGYADYSLRKFFETAEKQSWYKDTLFILTADHTYKSNNPDYQNILGRYRTPLIIFDPQNKLPRVRADLITQQTDLVPTILDYLGYTPDKKTFCSGRSIFAPGPRVVINYLDRRHLLISDKNFMTSFQGRDFQVFDISDASQKNPLKNFSGIGDIENILISKVSSFFNFFKNQEAASACQ